MAIRNDIDDSPKAAHLEAGLNEYQNEYLTARLRLRPLSMSDLDAAVAIHGDPATNQHNPGGVRSPAQTAALLELWTSSWTQHGFGYWTISTRAQPQQVIGFGGIMRKQFIFRQGEQSGLNLYFRFTPSAWGQAYALEMAQAALALAFDDLREDAVYGQVRPLNQASRRVLEKTGMHLVDETDDVTGAAPSLIYRITAAEYAQKYGHQREPKRASGHEAATFCAADEV